MLSGIGEETHLEEIAEAGGNPTCCAPARFAWRSLCSYAAGKPRRIHLQGVGRNLQDRYEVTVVNELDKDFATLVRVSFEPGDDKDRARRQWLQEKRRSLHDEWRDTGCHPPVATGPGRG